MDRITEEPSLAASSQMLDNSDNPRMFDEAAIRVLTRPDGTGELSGLLKNPEFYDRLAKLERWQLLPLLFKIRGKPYSLDDYPQFREMYPKAYPGETLFICGRQTSKSSNLSRSEVLDLTQIKNFQILYIAPLKQQADRYSSLYLKEAISTCAPAQMLQSSRDSEELELKEGPVIKSVGHQAFLNNSGIQMMYAKTSADRARGITADRCDFDEIQDQLVDHIDIIKESLTNSDWQLKRYTGTAKTTDNLIEHYWKQSTQSEWGVRCGRCSEWNLPTKEGRVLDMISAKGPVCAKCRGLLNVRSIDCGGTGELIHAYPDRLPSFLGVHVPQIFVPAIVYSPLKLQELIRKLTRLPESTIYTEIMGISSDTGLRLLTQADIDKASTLGTHDSLKAGLQEKYVYRVLGVDWGGGSDITSFTVSCVCGVTPEGQIHVLFAKRYVGMNMEDVITDIMRTSNAYKCDFIAADFGMGYTNNTLLRNRGQMVSQVQYCRAGTFFKFSNSNNMERWMADRNTALTMTFWAIRYGKIFFPSKEDSAGYTGDLLSPYEHLRELESGMTSKIFLRNPAIPDDFAHALTFASLMLMQVTGNRLITLVPESSVDNTGTDFPEGSNVDIAELARLRKG